MSSDSGLELRSGARFEALPSVRGFEGLELGEPGAHGERISGQRSGLIDGARGGDLLHESRRPPKAPTGRPPPMTFPSVVRSGVTP